jgi:hypothetical protein
MCCHVSGMEWLLNKLVNMRTYLAGGVDDKLSVSLWESTMCNCGGLSVAHRPIIV